MANDSIVVLTGSRKGEVHPLDREISFGRSPDNTIQMDDMQVSRRHAVVIPAKEGALLRDLGSGNGTLLDGVAVPPNTPTAINTQPRIVSVRRTRSRGASSPGRASR